MAEKKGKNAKQIYHGYNKKKKKILYFKNLNSQNILFERQQYIFVLNFAQ